MKQLFESNHKNLNKIKELNLLQFFQGQFEEFMNYLGELKKERPTVIPALLKAYILRFQTEFINASSKSLVDLPETLFQEFSIYQIYPEVAKTLGKAMLVFLNLERSTFDLISEKKSLDVDVSVKFAHYVQCGYFHVYYLFLELKRLIGEEKGMQVVKTITTRLFQRPNTRRPKFDTIKDLMMYYGKSSKDTHNFEVVEQDDGSYTMYTTGCLFGEALREVEDPELMYLIICYEDFFSVKHHNPNFAMSRSKTIVQGDNLCDFCYFMEKEK